jgi:hypothetical protein
MSFLSFLQPGLEAKLQVGAGEKKLQKLLKLH